MPIRRCSGESTKNSPPNDQNAWPPSEASGSWSSSSTFLPASASSAVATSPASPAPTTITSASIGPIPSRRSSMYSRPDAPVDRAMDSTRAHNLQEFGRVTILSAQIWPCPPPRSGEENPLPPLAVTTTAASGPRTSTSSRRDLRENIAVRRTAQRAADVSTRTAMTATLVESHAPVARPGERPPPRDRPARASAAASTRSSTRRPARSCSTAIPSSSRPTSRCATPGSPAASSGTSAAPATGPAPARRCTRPASKARTVRRSCGSGSWERTRNLVTQLDFWLPAGLRAPVRRGADPESRRAGRTGVLVVEHRGRSVAARRGCWCRRIRRGVRVRQLGWT